MSGESARKLPRQTVYLFILPFFTACSGLLDPNAGNLDENRHLWEQSGIENYTYRFQRSCFCAGTDAVIIEVRSGTITAITNADTDEPAPAVYLTSYRTVNGLFDEISDAIDRDAFKLEVTYHETLGYPTYIAIDYERDTVDEEVTYWAGSLVNSN